MAPRPVAESPSPAPESSGGPVALTAEQVSARWADIRTAVRNNPNGGKTLEPMLSAATVQSVGDGVIVLGHPIPPLVARLSEPGRIDMFNRIVADLFGAGWQVQVIHAQGAPASAAPNRQGPGAAAPRRQEFTRPSRGNRGAERRSADDGPPPPEPPPEPEEPWPAEPIPDEELSDSERDEMVASAHTGTPDPRLDPDQVALELLKSELGARPVDDGS